MLPKGCSSTKIKSAKTFLTVIPQKFIPSKYTRYTVACLHFVHGWVGGWMCFNVRYWNLVSIIPLTECLEKMSPLPGPIQQLVQKQNMEFNHNKGHFNYSYFHFMKQLLNLNYNYIRAQLEQDPSKTVSNQIHLLYELNQHWNICFCTTCTGWVGVPWVEVCTAGNNLPVSLWIPYKEDVEVSPSFSLNRADFWGVVLHTVMYTVLYLHSSSDTCTVRPIVFVHVNYYYSPPHTTPCRGPASDWYEAIQPYLMYSMNIRHWFVDTVFLQHKGRFCEYLLECPSVEVSLHSCL